ncbi:DUF3658 domain-containing protein [Burkholderia ambifaria]|uniref:DUF1835 domain-containing protein n=1 Tax=Burkholderia ambifaria MEX-5 TaxID=396597 RepID=B1T0Q7_9BURK|nr:DUF3658 domain-containing protein [Burkholderia ambifaria]EDT42882.1 Domain of unknown function DUF1835 [Burkholderia ambifaria MEX-5]
MSDFHLTSGDSAAVALRYAIDSLGLMGEVFCFRDDYALGPLSMELRPPFWQYILRNQIPVGSESGDFPHDKRNPWDLLNQRIKSDRPERIIIWTSGSGSDQVFRRIAFRYLTAQTARVLQVEVPAPPFGCSHSVAHYAPEDLVHFLSTSIVLSSAERQGLAEEFDAIAARPEQLREYDEGGFFRFRDLDAYDDRLLNRCTTYWRPTQIIVGELMGQMQNLDPCNAKGDAFLASRIQQLVEDGRIEADRVDATVWQYRVRKIVDSA